MSEAEERIWQALGEVLDPEFPISIVDMGLVYGLGAVADVVTVRMTLTSTACACRDWIEHDIRERLTSLGFTRVVIDTVWSPAWTPARISARAVAVLQQLGIAL